MKFYCHYTIYLGSYHIPYLLKGIGFRLPKGSFVDIVMDNPNNPEECRITFENAKKLYIQGFNTSFEISNEKYRMPNTNRALRRFLESDYDIFITPQDDQKIQGCDFIENIENLYKEKNIGIIGGRSGFDNMRYENMYSSSFVMTHHTKWLKSGEYRAVNLINDGALILSKETVKKIGLFDTNMTVFYIEVDYALRCTKAGLQNYVLGMELIHERWGKKEPSDVYKKEYDYGRKDLMYLKQKHGL